LVSLATFSLTKVNSFIILDEYNHEVYSYEKQIDCLLKHIAISTNQTRFSIFNCLMKFVAIKVELRVYAIPLFEQYLEHWDPELQQRAIEYIYLSKLNSECEEIPDITDIRYGIYLILDKKCSPLCLYSAKSISIILS
jgi:hypothetical protein